LDRKWSKYERVFVAGLVLFFLLGQFIIFFHPRDVWLDEAFSLEVVHKLQYEGLTSISWSSFDVHPPAYYVTLYVWEFLRVPFITESQWGRELSLLAGVFFFIVAFIGLRKYFEEKELVFSLVAMMFLSAYVYYFTEIRMYAFVLLLAALFVAGMSREFAGNWIYAGMAAALLLPLFHYFAIAGFLYLFVIAVVLLFSRLREDVKLRSRFILFGVLFALSSAVSVWLMISQVVRVPRGWLPVAGFSSWFSDVLSGFAYVTAKVVVPTWGFFAVLGLIGFVLFGVVAAFLLLKPGMSVADKFIVLMVAAIAGPLIAEFLITRFGPQPRYFLVVLWLLVVGVGLLVARRRWFVRVGYAVVVLMCLALFFFTELDDINQMRMAIGCRPATIVHDNSFSYLSFEVASREYGCGWDNYISTSLSEGMFTSQGGDIIDKDKVLWGKGVPDVVSMYIVGFSNSSLMDRNGSYRLVLQSSYVSASDWRVVEYSVYNISRLNLIVNVSLNSSLDGMVFVDGYGFVPADRVRFETDAESCAGDAKGWCFKNGS
jgi:hypothetical protein